MKKHIFEIKSIAIIFMMFAALGIFAGNVSAAEINGYYESDDGGAYFIRQVKDTVYWFGEHPSGSYANVLSGKITGNKIAGSFWDVPKGKAKGSGEITLEIRDNGATIVKISSTAAFGTKTFKKAVPKTTVVGGVPVTLNLPPEMRSRPEGFSGGEGNLTGAWTGNDAATYYVREMPNGVIVWVAENNFWGGPGGYAQPAFTHVFIGKKINKLITGEWIDVPKGKAKANGVLGLTINSQQDLTVNAPPQGIEANKLWRSLPNSLRGFADLHTHPMVNLALGGKFVHGGVDIGSLLPADSDCKHKVRATSIAHALGKDNSTHGGGDLFGQNPCGDDLRKAIIDAYQEQTGSVVTPDNAVGYPTFKDYPKWNDTTHQKMWVDWVRRSYDGGQRVLVALAMNNATLAAGVSGPGDGPTDDKASADLQIKEMKAFVARHKDFMEIAYTPADLRRIVAANKMAIILGIEIDNIGNFQNAKLTNPLISAEIQRLLGEGVRYIFPVHLVNNKFGGTAIYKDVFNLSNYHITGKYWDIQCTAPNEGITKKFKVDGFDFALAGAKITKLQVDFARQPPNPPNCAGHKNKDGLDDVHGEFALKEMMRRGMLIDIDHMSLTAVNETLGLAEKVPGGYPLVSGHTGLRNVEKTENSRDDEQLRRLGKLGGMFGLGTAGVKSSAYLRDYLKAGSLVGNGRVALGTDLNGLEKGPPPPVTIDITKPLPPQLKACPDIYNAAFVKSKTGDKTWDYCTAGVAHYGMLPDFLRDLGTKPNGSSLNTSILLNAEMFAQMWEKALKNSKGV